MERINTYTRNAVTDSNGRQACTMIERTISYIRNAIRDSNARQAGAILERRPSYVYDAVGDSNARQASAIIKCILIDLCYTVRQYEVRFFTRISDKYLIRTVGVDYISVFIGGKFTYVFRSIYFFCIITDIAVIAAPFCNIERRLIVNFHEFITTGERPFSYTRNAIRNSNARQAGATVERIISYTRNAIGDSNACQSGAPIERPAKDTRNAVGDSNARQAGTIIKRINTYTCNVIGDI